MALYTTRVELHEADSGDYDKLHKEMEKEGFSREAKSTKGKTKGSTFELPRGEYNYSGDVDRDVVFKKAMKAAKRVKDDPAVLVTQSAGRVWGGLKKVSK